MISIVSGTNRLKNKSLKVAEVYLSLCKENGVDAQILDLQSIPHDFLFTAAYGNKNADFDAIVEQYIIQASRFVFVVPEYNGSFPGMLKSFIDCIATEHWQGKRAALVGLSAGHLGNSRGLDHMTSVLHYLKMEVLSTKPKLSSIHKLLDEDGELRATESIDRLKSQLQIFLDF